MQANSEIWPKKITVDKRIVKILSESTYDSFPQSLKELIVNGYDADAKSVIVNIDIERETITISDNGTGMSLEDFDFYIHIAGQRREKNKKTKLGRDVIGQFGVGFLSVFPFFMNYHIESKRAGEKEILYADIPCYQYFVREKGKIIDISSISIQGGVKYDQSTKDSFTRITLTGFTPLAKEFFSGTPAIKPGKNSISSFDGLSKLKWYLEDDLPLLYEDESFNMMFSSDYTGIPFEVILNDIPLKRRVFGKVIMESSNIVAACGNIKYKYFICSNESPVMPSEATGLKIRNLNVGVGKRTTFGLGVEKGGTRSRLRWLTGEIHILSGLNETIKVSRDDFYFNSDYDDLKSKMISLLSKTVDTLETENEVNQFLSTNKIKNIKLLESKSLVKKVEKVITQKTDKPRVQLSDSNNNKPSKAETKEEVIRIDASAFEKKYRIKDKTYIIKSGSWDHKRSIYPACEIDGKTLTINKKYPLFSKQKHLDVFIRLNVLLLMWLEEGKISKNTFQSMSEDVIENFEEFI